MVGLKSSWYNIKGDSKGSANGLDVKGVEDDSRFLPFTEVGKVAVDARKHVRLKCGFGCLLDILEEIESRSI